MDSPNRKQASVFNGYFSGQLQDLTGREYLVLVDPDRTSFAKSSKPRFSSDTLLKRVTENPDYLRKVIEGVRIGRMCGFLDQKEKGSARRQVCLVLFPKTARTVTLAGTDKTTVPFVPGEITTLNGIRTEFGDPTEQQSWAEGDMKKRLGMDGDVYWWEDVGFAVDKQGSISHVLLRTSP